MISVEEAQSIILEKANPLNESEDIFLTESIGRVLAKDRVAPFDQPPFSNSAVDGFAVQSSGPLVLEVIKFQSAGSPFCSLPDHTAIEIATGAPLPKGADAVVMKEDVETREGKVFLKKAVQSGENVRYQGEDLVKGETLFLKGDRIQEKHLGLLASFGFSTVPVMRKPKIAYLATGNEIKSIGEPKEEYQIYNSNAVSLKALIEKEGCEFLDFGISKDIMTELVTSFQKALEVKPDIFILTGGVSVGNYDFVKEALIHIDADICFHKVSIKPGKPILFATLNNTLIFGLPGNPLSSQVCFFQFIYPAIQELLGCKHHFLETEKALLKVHMMAHEARHLFLIGIKNKVEGVTYVKPLPEGSGNVALLSKGNCFISIPSGKGMLEKNSWVTLQSYE